LLFGRTKKPSFIRIKRTERKPYVADKSFLLMSMKSDG